MATFDVDVEGVTYEVDAPDEQTAWQWANQTHSQETSGNIDLSSRPKVVNSDGTTSTVRSISFNEDGREILIPTVSEDGRIMTDEEAIDYYHRTGKHLGIFKSSEEASKAADKIHKQQESMIIGESEPQNKSLADTYLESVKSNLDKTMGAYSDFVGSNIKGTLGGASRIGNTLINASTTIPRAILDANQEQDFSSLITGEKSLSPISRWNRERQASLKDFRESYKDDPVAQFADVGTQIAGTAGVGNLLKAPAAAAGLSRLAEALESGGFKALSSGKAIPNALLRLAAGAGVGGASTAMVSPEDAGTGTVVGAGSVAVLNPILKGTALGAGKLADFVSGRLPAVSAAKIARDVAGPNLDEIIRANKVAPDDITSAQAAVDVPRFEWANLGQRAQQGDPTAYGLKVDAQEAKRLATLDAVTPDLVAAERMREKVTVPLYKKALESTKKVNTKPVTNLVDKFIEDNPKLASIKGPMSEIKNGLVGDTNVKSLVSLSQNIKEKIAAKNPDGTPMFDVKALTKVKESLDQQIGRAEPKYNTARNAYKRLSAPINQAKLLQEMKNTLVSSKGGERVTPFLNAMGQGEKSLFRRADQSARFGSIDEVLTPTQRQAKDKIVSELRRDAEVARRGKEAAKKVSEVITGDSIRARLPSLVDKWFSAANKGIDIAETGINKKTMAAISEGMKTGKSANEMLAVLPAEEQNKILNALIKMPKGSVVPTTAGVLSQEDF